MKYSGLLVFLLALAGCGSDRQPASQTAESDKPVAAHGSMEGTKSPGSKTYLTGKVRERIDADRYSYLRISTEAGEIWAAVPQTGVQAGEEVTVENPMPMDGFESKTLNRKFDKIMFGTLQPTDGESVGQMLMNAHSSVSRAESVGSIKVDKAPGPDGYTVEEIFTRRLALKDKKVAVRGKVTRVNANILGKTWIHLQDGTGDPQAKSNDLAVTSQATPSMDDTVLIEGVLRLDRNFGMGYVFPVIIEDATVTKE